MVHVLQLLTVSRGWFSRIWLMSVAFNVCRIFGKRFRYEQSHARPRPIFNCALYTLRWRALLLLQFEKRWQQHSSIFTRKPLQNSAETPKHGGWSPDDESQVQGFFLPWFSHTSCALRISHISRKYRCAERRQRKERPASLQQRQHLSELCRLICRVYLFIEFFHSLSGVGLVAPEESLPAEVDPSRRTIIFIVADGIHFRLNCFDISHRNRGGNDGHRDRITARLGWYKNT